MPPPDPICDDACKAKIILNGGNIAGIARSNFSFIEMLKSNPEAFGKLNGPKIIEILNRMEDDAVAVQKLLVEGVGYTGPTGKMLE